MKFSTGSHVFMRIICLIFTIFTIDTFGQGPDCTKEVHIAGDISFTSVDRKTLTANIDLKGEISFGETVCFHVKPELNKNMSENYITEIEGDYNEAYPLVYALNLTQVTRRYSVRDHYTFAKPSSSVYCVCDCPGGPDHCTDETDYCGNSRGPICQNIMVDSLANGCPLSFIAMSVTCCAVIVSPSDTLHRYIAYRLENFETFFDFTLSSYNASDGAFLEPPRKITKIMWSNGTPEDDDESEISIAANSMTVLDIPTSNLYTNGSDGEVMSGVEVNAINEFDFHKLGWFRINSSTATVGDTRKLQDVVSVNVTNCIEDKFSANVNVSYDENDVTPWGSPLNVIEGDQIISATYSSLGPYAKINYKVSPRMTFDLPLRIPAESFFQSGGSRLKDFSVEGSNGGSILTITFTDTSGVISGNVQSGRESDGYKILSDVNLIVPLSNFDEVTINLNFQAATEPITRVCLHHISNPGKVLCRNVMVNLITTKVPPLTPIGGPMSNVDVGKSDAYGGTTDEEHGLRWYHYLFPGQWFNGMDNMTEGLIMTFEITLAVITAGLIYVFQNYRKN